MARVMEIVKGTAAVTGGRVAVRTANHYITPQLAKLGLPAGGASTAAALLVQAGAAIGVGLLAGAMFGHDHGADVMKGGLSEPIVEGLKMANVPVLSESIAAYPMGAYPRALSAYPIQRQLGAGAPQHFAPPVFVDDDDDDD